MAQKRIALMLAGNPAGMEIFKDLGPEWTIVSDGQTAEYLTANGVQVMPIIDLIGHGPHEAMTRMPKRYNFLDWKVLEGIGYDRDDPGQARFVADNFLHPIDMVVVGLPLVGGTFSFQKIAFMAAALIMAAAENVEYVITITDPRVYEEAVIALLCDDGLPLDMRQKYAAKSLYRLAAFQRLAASRLKA